MSLIYDSPNEYDTPQPYDFSGAWNQPGTVATNLPHLSAICTLQGNGTFNSWQQGTIDEVSQCVEVVCGTNIGDRTVVPNFGIPDPVFTTGLTAAEVQAAINLWEDRAEVQVNVVNNGTGTESIQVRTSIRRGSTN